MEAISDHNIHQY